MTSVAKKKMYFTFQITVANDNFNLPGALTEKRPFWQEATIPPNKQNYSPKFPGSNQHMS
jgi:hypothetical protein